MFKLKKASESIIIGLGLKPNLNLPESHSLEEIKIRDSKTIAKRLLVLAYLYGISFKVSRRSIKSNLKTYKLMDDLSKSESKLLSKLFLTKRDKINIDWVTEGIEILGLAIGLWKEIPLLEFCDEDRQADLLPIKRDPAAFISNAKLISLDAIRQHADLMYRIHWITKRKEIGALGKHSNDVYMERHKAINWILNKNVDWDEVSTDT